MVLCVALICLQLATYTYGSVILELKPVNKHVYGKISLGRDNRQELDALFDTGSNHLWVVDQDAKTKIESATYTGFLEQKSISFKSDKTDYREKYSTGDISGIRGRDLVTIKTHGKDITMSGLEFGVATGISSSLNHRVFYDHGAIFGLNLVSKEVIPGEPEPSLNELAKQYPTFGFYLEKSYQKKRLLVFGEPDERHVVGEFTSHNVVKINGNYNGWNVKVTKLEVEHISIDERGFSVSEKMYAQLVTRNAAAIIGPKQLIKDINDYIFSYAQFKGEVKIKAEGQHQYHYFNCDFNRRTLVFAAFPAVKIFVDNKPMLLGPKDYIRHVSENYCESALIGADISNIVLGNLFMSRYFTKFDYTNKKIHFASANQIYL